MACIVKLPTAKSKGVVTFTTQEEVLIRNNPNRLAKFQALKDKYVTGLHYNWHNFNCKPDQLFDFHMAGAEDLKITNGEKINHITMDACNFVRPEYHISPNEKMWDVLYVANAVDFKDPITFLKAIREIYDLGRTPRVLYICPVPKWSFKHRHEFITDIWERYEKMFNKDEQFFFNLLCLYDNYPRYFDRQTLAHFYKSSKLFVHTAWDERRCRVAAYAFTCGNPVIAKASVGSILPPELRKEPYYYEVDPKTNNYADQILKALDHYNANNKSYDFTPYRREFACELTVPRLAEELEKVFRSKNLTYEGEILPHNLDHRMGRHHGFGLNTNSVNQNLDDFMSAVMDLSSPKNDSIVQLEFPEETLIKDPNKATADTNEMPLAFRLKKQFPILKRILT
jgi:hypothetical protein